MSTQRQQARKKTLLAQALVVVFAAGAGAAALLPRPDSELSLPTAEAGTALPIPSNTPHADANPQDLASVLLVMNTYVDSKDRPRAEARIEPEPHKDVVEAPVQPEDPKVTGGWRFVGSIMSSKSSAAIINDEHNKQHIMFTGDKLNGTTLVAVERDHVVLRDGDDSAPSRNLALEARPDTLLPDAPAPMASAMGGSEVPAEYLNTPPDFATWNPAQQKEWSEKRAQFMRQQQEINARNAANSGKPMMPPGSRSPVRPVQPGVKQPSTGRDFK